MKDKCFVLLRLWGEFENKGKRYESLMFQERADSEKTGDHVKGPGGCSDCVICVFESIHTPIIEVLCSRGCTIRNMTDPLKGGNWKGDEIFLQMLQDLLRKKDGSPSDTQTLFQKAALASREEPHFEPNPSESFVDLIAKLDASVIRFGAGPGAFTRQIEELFQHAVRVIRETERKEKGFWKDLNKELSEDYKKTLASAE